MLLGLSIGVLGAGLALGAPLPGDIDATSLEGGSPLLDESVPPPTRSVHLIYTGARDGIGSRYVVPDLFNQVRSSTEATGGSVTRVRAVHGVLSQEPWLLRAMDDRVEPVVDLLK